MVKIREVSFFAPYYLDMLGKNKIYLDILKMKQIKTETPFGNILFARYT